MNNIKQSSVEWLISQLQKSKDWHRVLNEVSQMSSARVDIIEQTKAMHKEEMEHFFKMGMSLVEGRLWKPIDKFEEAYNETFGGNNDNP